MSVLTPQTESFAQWYQDVIAKAGLAENGPVRGTMVIRPWAFAVWELLQRSMDDRIKRAGAENAYFPLLIPESFLDREAEHVEGFSPELAVVTHGGGSKLEEPAVIRPTSETIINHFFARWINSYRDLPLLLNQWGNVVRWELRPRLFLRTSEFLWQEGHTAHRHQREAHLYALRILHEVYADTIERELAIPVFRGRKTEREKFAGAVTTWTCEGVMRDGKALQLATSHELGTNFAEAFDIGFTDEDGQVRRPFQTSWGSTTRLLGATIMVHGDDAGLRLPPRVAPAQAVVLIARDGEGVRAAAEQLVAELSAAGVRVRLDDRLDVGTGRRIVDWELKGVPVRIELGPRDLQARRATVVRRIPGERALLPLDRVAGAVRAALEEDQRLLFEQALVRRDELTADCATLAEAAHAARTGAARVPWREVGVAGEAELARDGVSVRCLLDDELALVARAY